MFNIFFKYDVIFDTTASRYGKPMSKIWDNSTVGAFWHPFEP